MDLILSTKSHFIITIIIFVIFDYLAFSINYLIIELITLIIFSYDLK